MKKFYTAILLLFGGFLCANAVVIAQQDFESVPATPVLGYTNSGATILTGNSAAGASPSSSPYFVSTNRGININNGTATLTFPSTSTSIDVSAYTNISVSFRLASFSTNGTNGADGSDYVRIEISPNNGGTWYNQIEVAGNSNARWSYSAGTGIASRNYGTGGVSNFAPGGGGNRTTDGYSTIRVNNITPTSQLRIRITMLNNAAEERWVIDDVVVSGDTKTPTISASPNISGLNYFLGSGPSTAQSFSLSAAFLDPADDTIYAVAPTNFKIATAAAGPFVDTLKFPYTDSTLASTTLWTRLVAGLSVGSYADSITFTGGTAPTKRIGVSGSVVEPTITPSTTSITGLNYVEGLGASTPQLFTVSANTLTPTSGNLTVTAPTNFLICATETGTYTSSINIAYTGGALASANVFVVLQNGLSIASYADSISISGGGATTKKVGVSGNVVTNNCSQLFISEYVEASSNNKFIEIYNPTSSDIVLRSSSGVYYYKLGLYYDGALTSSPTNDFRFSNGATVPANGVYIVKHTSATIYSGGIADGTRLNFNGNDALALEKFITPASATSAASQIVDVIGRIGENPGTAWVSGTNSTLDRTLVRHPSVTKGVTSNPASGFPTLATEWISYPTDESHFLGSHVSTCQNNNYTIASVSSISPTSYCPGDAISIPFEAFGTYTGNTFTAQLSNASGSFASPVSIGTLALSGTNVSGTISATIPVGTAAGTQYHVRVISSTPVSGTLQNGQELTVLSTTPPNVTGAAAGNGTTNTNVTWTNPTTGCWQEVLVVLTTTPGLTFNPSGTGSGYTPNSVYSGSGNQVVYKGTGEAVDVSNLVQGTIYYFEIYVRNGSTWSSGVEVSRLVDPYCYPLYTYPPISPSIGSCDEYISNVTLETINNSTAEGCGFGGYSWHANQSTTLVRGETYILNVRVGIVGATNDESYSGDDLRVYIDFNQNGLLENTAERIINVTDNGGTGSYTFTVPSGAFTGTTRLRVQLMYYNTTDPTDPCGKTYRDGETEDYTINIIDPCTPLTSSFNFYPNNGTEGTEVKIFSNAPGNLSTVTNVLFNNIPATSYTIVDERTIYAIVPEGAGTGRITLVDNSPCKRNSSTNFTYELNTGTCNNYSELFISEIFDPGSGNNHYIEIFNGTESAINLDIPNNYTLRVVNKSSATDPSPTINTINITGVIQPGEVLVFYAGTDGGLANGSQASAGTGFNAYDEIQLFKNGSLIDVVQGHTAAGYNHRRKNTASAPSTTYASSDWDIATSGISTANIGLFSPTLPLKINTQPTDVNSCSISMSVAATGSGTITYQWYYNNNRANETGWTALTDGTTNFAAINHGLVTVAGSTLATLTITGDLTYLDNHQFYCVVSNGACQEYSNAAQFTLNPDRYFRSKQSGTWTSASNWEMATSAAGPWTDACTYPTYFNSDYVHIMDGDTITIWDNTLTNPDIAIDQLVIETGGQLVLDYNAEMQLTNASGVDMIVEGSFYYKGLVSPNGITFLANVTPGDSSSWILGTNGEIIKSGTASLNSLKERYDGGISNIPATAHWRFRKDTTAVISPAYSFNDIYYPNLYFENYTTGTFTFSLPTASFTSFATVKGNLSVGYSPGAVIVQNNNYNATPLTVLGNASIEAGSSFLIVGTLPNIGTGLVLHGNLLVDGTLDLNLASKGILEFKGDKLQTYSGAGTIDLYNVTLNKSPQTIVSLNRNLIVNNVLEFGTGGIIRTNTHEVSVLNNSLTSVIGFDTPNNTGIYSNDKYVNGKLRRRVTADNIYIFPVGDSVAGEAYNPSRLVLRTVPSNPEAVCEFVPSWPGAINTFRTFYCGGQLKFLDYQGLTGEGYWKYGGSTFTNYDVYIHPNLKNLNVLPNDDISRPPGALNYNNTYRALKEVDSKAGGVWDPNVSTAGNPCIVSPSYYEIIGAGYSGFSIFAPGGGLGNSTPLPIELLEFKAVCEEDIVNLLWSTASEKNVDYFTIEKSLDGINFTPIGNINAAGNSNIRRDYIFTDADYSGELTYYRLKETDFDANIYYHGIRSVECDKENGFINVFYNEGEGIVANLYSNKNKKYEFTVYDAAGRLILSNIQNLSEGSYRLSLTDTRLLAKGIYFVSVFDGKEIKSVKVLVK